MKLSQFCAISSLSTTRSAFYRPNGETQNQVAHGSVILGVGVDHDLFKLAFKEIGPCR